MNIEITKSIPRKEWLKALHVESTADQHLQEQLDRAQSLLFAAARPRGVYRIMAREDVRTHGISVEKHLEGCHKVIILGMTLGIDVDNLIRKTGISDMAKAVVLDSGASVLTEQLCDEFEDSIKIGIDGYMTSRFSPGYGDFPLEAQADMIRYIDGQRKIGLNITEDALMIPRKSVTAVIGIADHYVKDRLATCDECVLREKCILRKEGKFCGN